VINCEKKKHREKHTLLDYTEVTLGNIVVKLENKQDLSGCIEEKLENKQEMLDYIVVMLVNTQG
jgi:hypothetical protein